MEDVENISKGLKEIVDDLEPSKEVEKTHPLMEKKLIDSISLFFMNNTSWMIYKTFAEGGELDANFWDENLSSSILLSNKEGIDKDMLIVQIREATDGGLLTLANVLEEDEDEWEQLKSMNILAFDITEKGREYIMPFIKAKLTEHFEGIIGKVKVM